MAFIAAAANYPIEQLQSWDEYAAKITRWVQDASLGQGAALVVFPEYGSMELASLEPATMGDLARSTAFVASLMPQVDQLHSQLAMLHKIHILAATAPFLLADGTYVNRARLFTPHGAVGIQDKLIMTRYERDPWNISAGRDGLRLFDTTLGKIGITICYDSEFPLLARALVEAGMELLLVPSCTEKPHGYYRVKIGAQARALEGQNYVIHSPTIGSAPWSPCVDTNHGAAAIYSPPDSSFPDDGIIAVAAVNVPQWVVAPIDISRVHKCRESGGVLNMTHWMEQPGAGAGAGAGAVPVVEIIDLCPPLVQC